MALVQSFSSAHKELYPGQNNRRWKYLALCLFSPWQSSRAMDLLGEELFAEFHPFAVGKVLLEETERNLFFRRWLLELKYPADSPRGNAVSQLFPAKDRELKKLTLWMAQAGLNYQASLPPPTPTQSSQKSYCPRCETAYTLGKGTCLDCGRNLIPF
jgi:hypothetical protein